MNELDVFIAALQFESHAERQACLDEACGGDEALRRQVEALLDTHDRAGSFLQQPIVVPVGVAALLDRPARPHLGEPASSWRGAGAEKPSETQGGATDPDPEPLSLAFLGPAEGPDEIGRFGGYRVLKVLGAGGMGMVFHAEDPELKRPVALKVMLPHLAASPSARKRFRHEAQATAAIEHDHIVPIYCVGEDRGVPFLAMPLLKGEALDARLQRDGQLPLAEVLRIGREVAEGLAAAHERGLIHRDVKPGNLWLEGERGRVKVLDFGLARVAGGESQLTQPGAIVGTPAYMAPEQVNGSALDARCDLFALGVMLYRIATGELPFKGTDPISTMMAVATESPKAPRELNASLPPALNSLILRLLAKDVADRPSSATEVAGALLALEQEAAGLAPSAGKLPGSNGEEATALLFRPAFPTARRRRWLALAGGVGLAGVVIILLLVGALADAFRGHGGRASGDTAPGAPTTPPDGASNGRAGGSVKATAPVRPVPPEDKKFPLIGHGSYIQGLAFTVDGKTLVSADYWGQIMYWNMDRREKTFTISTLPGGLVESLAVDRLGRWLAVGLSGEIRLFSFREHLQVGLLKGHTGRVLQLAFLKDGRTLLSTGDDGSIRRWDVEKQQPEGKMLRASGPRLDCLNVWEDGQGGLRLALGGSGFAGLDDEVLDRIPYSPGMAALSPDGTRLACTAREARDDSIVLYKLPEKMRLGLLTGAPRPRGLAFTPDSKHVAVMGKDETRIYETASGEQVAHVEHAEVAMTLAVSPDGRWLAVGTQNGTIRVWHLPSLLAPPG